MDYEMKYEIEIADMSHTVEILSIYQSLIGSPGCSWNEAYPALEDVETDIKTGSLYMMCGADRKVIAAAAAGRDEELEPLDCWNGEITRPCGLARVGVRREYQNQGIAKILIRQIEKDVIRREFDGIHFLVSKTNAGALAVYHKLGYQRCGETALYDINWYCYEKKLTRN